MPPSIGLQLYTLRESLVHDLASALRRVAEIDYQGVETAFFDPRVRPPTPLACYGSLVSRSSLRMRHSRWATARGKPYASPIFWAVVG